jgi:hypothetical protein
MKHCVGLMLAINSKRNPSIGRRNHSRKHASHAVAIADFSWKIRRCTRLMPIRNQRAQVRGVGRNRTDNLGLL